MVCQDYLHHKKNSCPPPQMQTLLIKKIINCPKYLYCKLFWQNTVVWGRKWFSNHVSRGSTSRSIKTETLVLCWLNSVIKRLRTPLNQNTFYSLDTGLHIVPPYDLAPTARLWWPSYGCVLWLTQHSTAPQASCLHSHPQNQAGSKDTPKNIESMNQRIDMIDTEMTQVHVLSLISWTLQSPH